MSHEIEIWISDQLIEILYFSDRHTAQFLASLAKNSVSVEALLNVVEKTETIDVKNVQVQSFLRELWLKIPRAPPKVNLDRIAAKEREKKAIELIEKNKRYRLVEESDEEEKNEPPANKVKKRSTSESDDEEKKRAQDLKERDDFSERLKNKDKEKQRNIVAVGKGNFPQNI